MVEILSPWSVRRDRVAKAALYARFGIRHYWIVDPEARTLEVYETANGAYRSVATYQGAGKARSSPFPDLEIALRPRGDRLRLQLSNPYHEDYQHRQGNRMALDNIRERLQLHFDVEASLDTRIAEGRYEIGIVMPYRAGP